MSKNIKRVLKWLLMEYVLVWLVVISAFIMGEINVIPNGVFSGKEYVQLDYYLNMSCIAVTLIFVVLSLKLFSLNTRKGLKRMNHDEALGSYHLWSVVRIGMLMLSSVYGIALYFLMLDTTGVFCACISMVTTLVCIPSENKINNYIELLDNNVVTTDVVEE